MTEVLHSPSHFPPSPSSNSTLFHTQTQPFSPNPNSGSPCSSTVVEVVEEEEGEGVVDHGLVESDRGGERKSTREKEREEISLLALLVAVLRKSLVSCKASTTDELSAMDIGWPTNVRHVAHVTYDRFNGFLGLPVEFEPEVPMRAPSASTSVFGVSTGSMQLSYDTRGNCVPTILLLMQRQLYAQGGLQAEGIFRINAENSQEEIVRDQLNRGIIPDDIDVHILAGLIKAWFRELPTGIMDLLSPEQIMQCESEEDCAELVRLLPSSEASLLNWAINLMSDVVQEEQFNKMNAHNIAMVFAPNMTQMADPLTALMHAVRVMNFLKTLIMKTLQERADSQISLGPITCAGPSNDSGHQSPSQPPSHLEDNNTANDNSSDDSEEQYSTYDEDEATLNSSHTSTPFGNESDESSSHWDPSPSSSKADGRNVSVHVEGTDEEDYPAQPDNGRNSGCGKEYVDVLSGELPTNVIALAEKGKDASSNLSRISARLDLIEAWM